MERKLGEVRRSPVAWGNGAPDMSSQDELPAFVRRHFRNVWALEIVLLLRRDPGRTWQVEEVVRELRASRGLAQSSVEEFERAGFIVRDAGGGYRFAPASPVIDELCELLERAFRERPVAIINLISAPEDRLQQLADAFRFKERPE